VRGCAIIEYTKVSEVYSDSRGYIGTPVRVIIIEVTSKEVVMVRKLKRREFHVCWEILESFGM